MYDRPFKDDDDQEQQEQYQTKAQRKSRKSDEAVHTITFGGIYAATTQEGPVQKSYQITLKVPHVAMNRESNQSAKSVFKHLAIKFMPRKYPDFIRLITYHILKVDSTHPQVVKKTLELLNHQGLCDYIDDEELDVDPGMYDTEDKLRKAIKLCEKDPAGYRGLEKHLRSVHGVKLKARAVTMNINNEEFDKLNDVSFDENNDSLMARTGDEPVSTPGSPFAPVDAGLKGELKDNLTAPFAPPDKADKKQSAKSSPLAQDKNDDQKEKDKLSNL